MGPVRMNVAVLATLLGAALGVGACSPMRPDPVQPVEARVMTGRLVPFDENGLWLVFGGRSIWTVHRQPRTRFVDGTLTSFDAIGRANADGQPVNVTIEGVEFDLNEIWIDYITADAGAAMPSYTIGPWFATMGGQDTGVPSLQLGGYGRWTHLVTAWTEFDPAGDYVSTDEMIAASLAGEHFMVEGEGADIDQQLTVFRRIKVLRADD